MADYISKFQYNGTTWDMKDAEARQALALCVNNGYYDSNSKKIILRHDSTTIVQIDATDFIKDGMVSNVQVVNGYLVITFNTDAGQEPIRIPITDIFNPDNYYTKSATNGLLALKQDIIQDLVQIRQGASAGSTAYQKPQGGIPLSDINTNDIDGAPTQNSNKLVRSGGVQNELALGAVYDVSAHNNGSTFASLSALLNAANIDTLIPTSVRKGGMSIKFVLTSDNKYVQHRLTKRDWSIDVDDWTSGGGGSGDAEFLTGEKVSEVGIDDEPTPESENLVKSGGVYDNYARQDGYYETLGVGEAKNIIGQIPQDAGFIYRTAGGNSEIADGLSHVKKIQGNVVSWNQLMENPNDWVDMGLPSGTLWCKKNLDVTQPNGLAASEFQYECTFFSWGNKEGHNPVNNSFVNVYDWGTSNDGNYAQTEGAALTTDADIDHDGAIETIGGCFRDPSKDDFAELLYNIDYVQADGVTVVEGEDKRVTVNGVKGIYLRSKINGNLLFFPCSGFGNGTDAGVGFDCYIWSRSLFSQTNGYAMYTYWGRIRSQGNMSRHRGGVRRPVLYKSTSTQDGKHNHKYAVSSNGKNITDVTITYGTGNEPSSVAQFEQDYFNWFGKPLDYEPYNEGTLIPMKMQGIKTVGFNQYNPITGIVKGLVVDGGYQITGTYTSITQDGVEITPNANGIFTIEKAGDIVVNGGDDTTCVHFVYDGHRNGEYEPYKEHNYDFDVTRVWGKLNGEGSYVQIAPEGLRSATPINSSSDLQNAVADLIEFGEDGVTADVKVGSVDLGSLNYSKFGDHVFLSNVTGMKVGSELLCATFVSQYNTSYSDLNNKAITRNPYNTSIAIRDDAYDNAESFKSYLVGIPLYYGLATPLHYTDLMLDKSVAGNGSQLEPITNIRPIVDNYGTEEIIVPASQDDMPTSCNHWITIQYDINAAEHIDTFEKHGIKDVALHDNLQALCNVINANCSEQLGGTISISDEPNDNLVYSFTFTANAQTQSVTPQSETI